LKAALGITEEQRQELVKSITAIAKTDSWQATTSHVEGERAGRSVHSRGGVQVLRRARDYIFGLLKRQIGVLGDYNAGRTVHEQSSSSTTECKPSAGLCAPFLRPCGECHPPHLDAEF
jgi:hypothetical protein